MSSYVRLVGLMLEQQRGVTNYSVQQLHTRGRCFMAMFGVTGMQLLLSETFTLSLLPGM